MAPKSQGHPTEILGQGRTGLSPASMVNIGQQTHSPLRLELCPPPSHLVPAPTQAGPQLCQDLGGGGRELVEIAAKAAGLWQGLWLSPHNRAFSEVTLVASVQEDRPQTGQSKVKDHIVHLLEDTEVLKSTHTLCFVQINFLIFFFPNLCNRFFSL